MIEKYDIKNTPRELYGKYNYIKLLGEGANGKTWLAKSLKTGQLVAVKELKFGLNDTFKSLELFKREAVVLQSVQVAGVPRFYESILPEDCQAICYIIQEYVSYPPLSDILANLGQLSEADTLLIMEKIARILFALQTQYSPPIIHRDIKPSNIMCQKKEDGDVDVFLIDFGAVANPQKRSGGSTVAGTFGYMAPEQLLGDVTIQSDYYALGATALHCLTGVVPYEMDSDGFELRYRDVILKKAPGVSDNMMCLLDNLLAPEVEKRPMDAAHLILQIHQVMENGSPNVDSVRYRRKRTLNFTGMDKYHIFSSTPGNDWPSVAGVIRCTNTIYNDLNQPVTVYEYTFVAGDLTYVGFMETDQNFRQRKLPVHCEVRYDPYDPRLSTISKYPDDWGLQGCKFCD